MWIQEFQAIIFDKRKGGHTNQIINIEQRKVKMVSKVKLLGMNIDDKLNFDLHSNNICKSAWKQPNTLTRLKHLSRFGERKVLVITFVMLDFNYFSLVRNFSSTQKSFMFLVGRLWQHLWLSARKIIFWKYEFKQTKDALL